LVLLSGAEDGGIRFLRNFDELLSVYTASHGLRFIISVVRTSDTADKMIYGERCHFTYVLMDVGGVEVKFQLFHKKKTTRVDADATETKRMLETEEMCAMDWPCRNPDARESAPAEALGD
jgi:hypothetical protein